MNQLSTDIRPALIDTSIRTQFVRRAGLLYGAIFAIGFALALWGPDAYALQQAAYNFWWGKLAIGAAIVLPLCMLTGWLSASVSQSAISIFLWIIAAPLIILIAAHVPFDGISWLAGLNDPYPSGQPMYPFSTSSAAVTGIMMLIGAGAGLFAGLLSIFAIDRAWDRSTRANRFSLQSILLLGLGLLPIIPLAPITDNNLDASLRVPFIDVHAAIQAALDPEVNLTALHLPFLNSVRNQLTTDYTLLWVETSPDQDLIAIDAQFNNGFLLRCNYNFGSIGRCLPLDQNLKDVMTQLMTAGHITCAGCGIQTDRDTRRWLNTAVPTLNASAKLQQVNLLKHQSGWIYERAIFNNGQAIDCRFSGNSPIVVDLCIEVKPQG